MRCRVGFSLWSFLVVAAMLDGCRGGDTATDGSPVDEQGIRDLRPPNSSADARGSDRAGSRSEASPRRDSGLAADGSATYKHKGVGLVIAADIHDATAAFHIATAVAVFHKEQTFTFEPAPVGTCRVIAGTKGGGSWLSSARTPAFPPTTNVGATVTLSKDGTSLALSYENGQYNLIELPPELQLGAWKLAFGASSDGTIPSYSGPGPELPDRPSYATPPMLELNVSTAKALSLSYAGKPADFVIVDMFSHTADFDPLKGSGAATEVVCAFADTGALTVPQPEVAKMISGYGQVEIARFRYTNRPLANGTQVVCIGMTGFYYNASFGP